jgi:hypothetical protein
VKNALKSVLNSIVQVESPVPNQGYEIRSYVRKSFHSVKKIKKWGK